MKTILTTLRFTLRCHRFAQPAAAFSFDGQDWLVGNDRYCSFVKSEGRRSCVFRSKDTEHDQDTLSAKELQQAGVSLTYKITPISQYYTDGEQIRQMFWILSLLAFVLLAASVLNYVLIVVGNMVTRAREMAVRKCYGAGRSIIYVISFAEAAVHLLIAVALGALLSLYVKAPTSSFCRQPLRVLLFNRGSWILALSVCWCSIVGGIIPAWLYNRMLWQWRSKAM
jgi:putative ABC transport system permease protein